MRSRVWAAALLLTMAAAARAQAPAVAGGATPSFEVATVKPSDPAEAEGGFSKSGRQVTIQKKTVTSLIMYAYGVHKDQIVDGPAWMSDAYDIRGTTDTM